MPTTRDDSGTGEPVEPGETVEPGESSAPEWTAEHDVDRRLAARLVGRRFPQLPLATVEPLATGWDNTVFLVDGEWVFRFPRRAVALECLRRETAVLPRIAGRLPLPVPLPELIGEPGDDHPWPFWGARLLPGTELADSALPDRDRVRAGASAGAFLRALHDPELARTAGAGLPVDPLRRADPSVRAPMARERLDRLRGAGVLDERCGIDRLERLLAEGDQAGGPSGAEPVLVHGDLHVRHLLVNSGGDATGVIDWGDVCLADPATDLALAYAGFTGAAREAFLAAYGPAATAEPGRELAARVLAVFLCAVLADYAASIGRATLLTECLAGLERAIS